MSIELIEEDDGKVAVVEVRGNVTKRDYKMFVPKVECLLKEYGKIRMLMRICDVNGWTLGAMWEDFKFCVKHFWQIERLAVVGDRVWQHSAIILCRPFTTAPVRYFDRSESDEADYWIRSDFNTAPSRS